MWHTAKQLFVLSPVAFVLGLSATLASAQQCTGTSPTTRVPVIELYTSQGCSSCPPADHWLSQFAPNEAAVRLSLHVKYWDYIGWKDPFAKVEFAERQRQLATRNRSTSVYTPGVFLSGVEWRDWSGPGHTSARWKQLSAAPSAADIQITDTHVNVQLRELGRAAREPQLLVALTKDNNVSKVNAGENRGETLKNDYVVTYWSGPVAFSPQGQAKFALPSPRSGHRVAAIVQDRLSGEVLQAFQTKVCGIS
jgi:hypothetical protein